MAVLDNGINFTLEAMGLGAIPGRKPNNTFVQNDFQSGLVIEEIVDGKPINDTKLTLLGSFMPMVPFEFGGTQNLTFDYYPGNPDPTVHVLGSRELDTVIRGRFKTKKIKQTDTDVDLRMAAWEYQLAVDSLRKRGNLLRITLGDLWVRYGFIERSAFKLRTITDIDYEITFSIVGEKPPENYKVISDGEASPSVHNRRLIDESLLALSEGNKIPESMPQTAAEFLTNQIGILAGYVSLVTNSVNEILSESEEIVRSSDRLIGLIRNVRSKFYQTSRRLDQLSTSIEFMGKSLKNPYEKTSSSIQNVKHIHKIKDSLLIITNYLAILQKSFESLKKTIPIRRHLVKSGETIQSISIKYYNSPENWLNIYNHNKMRTTELVAGSVIEIPKV